MSSSSFSFYSLQVEFEARTPEEVDFHGICGLLRKAYRTSSGVDVSGLADFIIRFLNLITNSREILIAVIRNAVFFDRDYRVSHIMNI